MSLSSRVRKKGKGRGLLLIQRVTIPLSNVDRDKESFLDLGNARIVSYESLGSSVRQVLDRLDARFKPILDLGLKCKFFLETDCDENNAQLTLDRTLMVFKLFKNEPLLSRVVIFGEKELAKIFMEYSYWVGADRKVIPSYFLGANEEATFADFWREFETIETKNFAVYRFNLADFRPYLRDSYVDYVEALEFLLVPDYSGRGSISPKLSRRGGLILGLDKSFAERKSISTRLLTEYRLRSALVHGDEEKVAKHLGTLGIKRWADALPPARSEVSGVMKYVFRAGCLDDRIKRAALLKRLESQVAHS